MTIHKQIAERLESIDGSLPLGPWKVWTSCSFRRITGPDGRDGGVLSAYNQRSDNHPDLSMPEEQLAALVEMRNMLSEVIQALRQEPDVPSVEEVARMVDLKAFDHPAVHPQHLARRRKTATAKAQAILDLFRRRGP